VRRFRSLDRVAANRIRPKAAITDCPLTATSSRCVIAWADNSSIGRATGRADGEVSAA
jgi:hypothetical protein